VIGALLRRLMPAIPAFFGLRQAKTLVAMKQRDTKKVK
jgi:hypothetical protein